MSRSKQEVITFKVDESLAEVIRRIPNRSQFIRSAVLSALDHLCPLCQGTGILTPDQRNHWTRFQEHHTLRECPDCESMYLECDYQPDPTPSEEAEHEHP